MFDSSQQRYSMYFHFKCVINKSFTVELRNINVNKNMFTFRLKSGSNLVQIRLNQVKIIVFGMVFCSSIKVELKMNT